MAPPTPAWDPLLLAPTDPPTRRWAALARTAALGWAARLLGWALSSTSLIVGPAQKPANLAWTITIGKADLRLKTDPV